jgi:hypothetical protein
MDLLSFMHEADPYGHLRLNGHDLKLQALARMMGSPLKEVRRHLEELEAAGVFSRTETGTIYSRRMVRDEALREMRAAGGHLSLQNPAVPRPKDTEKDPSKDTFRLSMAESIGCSPSSSFSSSSLSSSSPSSSEKQTDASPSALELEFEEFWKCYPARNGKRLGKQEALRKWKTFNAEDCGQILLAVRNYASSKLVLDGIGIKDPHRWLRNGKGDEPWRDWLEPEQANQHTAGQICTKRVRFNGSQLLHECRQPASPHSRPNEPRCPEHLSLTAREGSHVENR